MKKNILGVAIITLFTLLMVAFFVVISKSNATIGIRTETETPFYLTGNDGGFIPVYYIKATATRMADVVEVEVNGNQYSAYITPDSEIQTGDQIVCKFACYEGELEFIGID